MQLEKNRGKMVYLQIMFDKECEELIGQYLKKNKNKQYTAHISSLGSVNKKLRDILLKRWITRAKITHSLAFF